MNAIKKIITICIFVILTGCNIPGIATTNPTPDIARTLDYVRTEVAQTVTAGIPESITNTPILITATDTLVPVEQATMTLMPTETVIPPTDTSIPPTETSTPTPTNTATTAPTSTTASNVPNITIVGVEKNSAITVQTKNFPASQTFTIRMGPFNDYYDKKVIAGTINSGTGGTFKFTVKIPGELKDVETITVRLDSSAGYYAYNAFKNVNSGTVSYDPTAKPSELCTVTTTTNPTGKLEPGENFDAIWTIKNTSDETWSKDTVDYKYSSGEKMYKYAKLYDLPKNVKAGKTIELVVDMTAPDEPGTYTTKWVLVEGSKILCTLPLTITVK